MSNDQTNPGDKSGGAADGGQKTEPTWRDTLPEEMKSEPSLQLIADIPMLAKSYLHSQKMVGADKILKPSKHATADDWKKTFKDLGVPDEKDYKLDFNDQEKTVIDQQFAEFFQKLSAQEQLFPDKAKKVLMESAKFIKTAEEARQNGVKLENEKALTALKDEWGAAYDIKTQQANLAFKTFGKDIPELDAFLVKSGLGNNPAVIKMFAAVGETLKEGKIINSSPSGGAGPLTPKEAQVKIDQIMGRPQTDPFWDKNHPNHKNAVQEMNELFVQVHPSESA